jgi:threonine dehydrogenase-like Zn-dependent dehydrogenase
MQQMASTTGVTRGDPTSTRTMRAAIFETSGVIRVEDRPYPVVAEPTDAVVRVVLACVCGGDLWIYRGESPYQRGPIGDEFIGVVEDVGADVRGIAKGDLVIAPSAFSDGSCPTAARASQRRASPAASGASTE